MADEHMASKMKLAAVDKSLLDLFVDMELLNNDEAKRAEYTQRLMNFLKDKQEFLDELCEDFQYAVHQLVKGLASDKECVRLGFSVSLCQLLQCFPNLPVEFVLGSIEKHLEIKKQNPKFVNMFHETRQITLGRIFGYFAIIQSERLQKSSNSMKRVVELLKSIQKEEPALRQLTVSGIAQIVQQISKKMLRGRLWPLLKKELTVGWNSCMPEQLVLLILCEKKCPDVVDHEFLEKYWSTSQLVSEKNYTFINDVLLHSSPDHPVIEEIVKSVVSNGLQIPDFWSGVVKSFFESTNEKKRLGMHMFLLLLPHLKSADEIVRMLSPDVVGCLLDNMDVPEDKCSNTQKPLTSLCHTAATKLVNFVTIHTDGCLQMAVLRCLYTMPGTLQFDVKTKSTTVKTITEKLTSKALEIYVEDLLRILDGENVYKCENAASIKESRSWAVSSLCMLVTHSNMSSFSSCRLNILQALCRYAFFCKTIQPCPGKMKSRSKSDDLFHLHCTSNFFKALNNLAIFKPENVSKRSILVEYINILCGLIHYVQKLFQNPGVWALKVGLNSDKQEEWDKVIQRVDEIHTTLLIETTEGNKYGFKILFLFLGFKLLTNSNDSVNLLKDVHICYKKACLQRKMSASPISDDEPQWIEVMTEVLVCLMSHPSSYTRTIVSTVMSLLAPQVTQKSLAVILEVLNPFEEEETPFDFEEEDKDDDAEVDNVDETKDNIIESSDNDEEEEEEEEAANVDALKQSVKSALGKAAASSDDEDIPDLSDSEMFKLDDALSEAFKSLSKSKRKKETKEKKKQMAIFKIRLLDMITSILKSHPSSYIIVDLIFPMLNLMNAGQKEVNEKDLRKKASDIFLYMCKLKKISNSDLLDRSSLLQMLEDLIQFSTEVIGRTMETEVSTACILVIQIMLNFEDSGISQSAEPQKTKVTKEEKDYKKLVVKKIKKPLLKCLSGKDKRSLAFFHALLQKMSVLFWPLSKCLVSTIEDSSVQIYCKTQASNLLCILLNNSTEEQIGKVKWHLFTGRFQDLTQQVIMDIDPRKLYPKFLDRFFSLIVAYLKMNNIETNRKLLSSSILQKLDNIKGCLDTDCRRHYNSIVKTASQVHGIVHKQEKKRKHKEITSTVGEYSSTGTSAKIAKVAENGKKILKKTKKQKETDETIKTTTFTKKKEQKHKEDIHMIKNNSDPETKIKRKNERVHSSESKSFEDNLVLPPPKKKKKKLKSNKNIKNNPVDVINDFSMGKEMREDKIGKNDKVKSSKNNFGEDFDAQDVVYHEKLAIAKTSPVLQDKKAKTVVVMENADKSALDNLSDVQNLKKKRKSHSETSDSVERKLKKRGKKRDGITAISSTEETKLFKKDRSNIMEKSSVKITGIDDSLGSDPDISLGCRFEGSNDGQICLTIPGDIEGNEFDVELETKLEKDNDGDVWLRIPDDIECSGDEDAAPIVISEDESNSDSSSNFTKLYSILSPKSGKEKLNDKENVTSRYIPLSKKGSVLETEKNSMPFLTPQTSLKEFQKLSYSDVKSLQISPATSPRNLKATSFRSDMKYTQISPSTSLRDLRAISPRTDVKFLNLSPTTDVNVADCSSLFSEEPLTVVDISDSSPQKIHGSSELLPQNKRIEILSGDDIFHMSTKVLPESPKKLRARSLTTNTTTKLPQLGSATRRRRRSTPVDITSQEIVENSCGSSGEGTENTVDILLNLASPQSANEKTVVTNTLEIVDEEITFNYTKKTEASECTVKSPVFYKLSSLKPQFTNSEKRKEDDGCHDLVSVSSSDESSSRNTETVTANSAEVKMTKTPSRRSSQRLAMTLQSQQENNTISSPVKSDSNDHIEEVFDSPASIGKTRFRKSVRSSPSSPTKHDIRTRKETKDEIIASTLELQQEKNTITFPLKNDGSDDIEKILDSPASIGKTRFRKSVKSSPSSPTKHDIRTRKETKDEIIASTLELQQEKNTITFPLKNDCSDDIEKILDSPASIGKTRFRKSVKSSPSSPTKHDIRTRKEMKDEIIASTLELQQEKNTITFPLKNDGSDDIEKILDSPASIGKTRFRKSVKSSPSSPTKHDIRTHKETKDEIIASTLELQQEKNTITFPLKNDGSDDIEKILDSPASIGKTRFRKSVKSSPSSPTKHDIRTRKEMKDEIIASTLELHREKNTITFPLKNDGSDHIEKVFDSPASIGKTRFRKSVKSSPSSPTKRDIRTRKEMKDEIIASTLELQQEKNTITFPLKNDDIEKILDSPASLGKMRSGKKVRRSAPTPEKHDIPTHKETKDEIIASTLELQQEKNTITFPLKNDDIEKILDSPASLGKMRSGKKVRRSAPTPEKHDIPTHKETKDEIIASTLELQQEKNTITFPLKNDDIEKILDSPASLGKMRSGKKVRRSAPTPEKHDIPTHKKTKDEIIASTLELQQEKNTITFPLKNDDIEKILDSPASLGKMRSGKKVRRSAPTPEKHDIPTHKETKDEIIASTLELQQEKNTITFPLKNDDIEKILDSPASLGKMRSGKKVRRSAQTPEKRDISTPEETKLRSKSESTSMGTLKKSQKKRKSLPRGNLFTPTKMTTRSHDD